MSHPSAPLEFPIVIGPDLIEGEPVGVASLQRRTIGKLMLTSAFATAIRQGNVWSARLSESQREELLIQTTKALEASFPDWLREWFTAIVEWQVSVGAVKSGKEFLDWLESEFHHVPRLLSVPAVQQWIRTIQKSQSAENRKRLSRILAHQWNGRPRRVVDTVLYHEWRRAVGFLEEAQADHTKENSVPSRFRSGLSNANEGKISKMAYQWVAESRRISPLTVEQRVGRVNARRGRRRTRLATA